MRYINLYSCFSPPSANLQQCHQHSHSPWKLRAATNRQQALLKMVTLHPCKGRLLNAGTASGVHKLFLPPLSQSPLPSPSQQCLQLVHGKVSSGLLPQSFLRNLGACHEHFCKHNQIRELLVALHLHVFTFISVFFY